VEPGADDVPVGTINVGADGADPRSGDNAGSPRRDLVVRGTDSCTLRHTTLGDTVLALGSSGAMGGCWIAYARLPRFSVPAPSTMASGE
jgi:hypothetical protein